MVRVFAHDAMGRRIDPSWDGPNEQFLVPTNAPLLMYQRPCRDMYYSGVTKAVVYAILSVGWCI